MTSCNFKEQAEGVTTMLDAHPSRPIVPVPQPQAYDWDDPVHARHPWARASLGDLAQALEAKNGFPCSFARSAYRQRMLHFAFVESPFCPQERRRLRTMLGAYLDTTRELSGIVESMTVLMIVFRPETLTLSVDAYHQQAWMVMQDWIDNDSQPWPDAIPTDPEAPFWSVSFGSVPLFVNISSPAHAIRRSRNLGASLVLVTQPRAGFDLVAGPTPEGDRVRARIRADMERFDGIPAPPDLGTYARGDLEWKQYALQEHNEDDGRVCPLVISRSQQDAA
jgi:FPC/CPF motif-containing protein YcgG